MAAHARELKLSRVTCDEVEATQLSLLLPISDIAFSQPLLHPSRSSCSWELVPWNFESELSPWSVCRGAPWKLQWPSCCTWPPACSDGDERCGAKAQTFLHQKLSGCPGAPLLCRFELNDFGGRGGVKIRGTRPDTCYDVGKQLYLSIEWLLGRGGQNSRYKTWYLLWHWTPYLSIEWLWGKGGCQNKRYKTWYLLYLSTI